MITLRKVDKRNIWSIVRLKVHDEQQSFVATNTESIYNDDRRWCCFAVWHLR